MGGLTAPSYIGLFFVVYLDEMRPPNLWFQCSVSKDCDNQSAKCTPSWLNVPVERLDKIPGDASPKMVAAFVLS